MHSFPLPHHFILPVCCLATDSMCLYMRAAVLIGMSILTWTSGLEPALEALP